MAEFKVGDPVRVLRKPGFAYAYNKVGVIIDYDPETPGLYRRYIVDVPTEQTASGVTPVGVAWDEIERDRPLPPALEFETPPCSLCSTSTDYDEGRFRCPACRCTWPGENAHLRKGRWEDREAEQCPDVLTAAEGGLVGSERADCRCIRTAGHAGDHLHPDGGDWTSHDGGGAEDGE